MYLSANVFESGFIGDASSHWGLANYQDRDRKWSLVRVLATVLTFDVDDLIELISTECIRCMSHI